MPQRFRFGGGGQNCGRALPDGAADDVDLLEHPPGQRLDRSTVSAERATCGTAAEAEACGEESHAVNGQAPEGESGARLSNHRKFSRRGSVYYEVSDARRLNRSPYCCASASSRRPVSQPSRG